MSQMARLFGVICLVASAAAAAEPQRMLLPVTADVGITSVRGKERMSNALGSATEIRQNQNWSGFEAKTLLMAFDTEPIQGWTVEQAWLNVTVASKDLYGLGLCTVLASWHEGRTLNWTEAPGSPCWDFVRLPESGAAPTADNFWAWPGSRIYSVTWAHPSLRYSHAGPNDITKWTDPQRGFVQLRVPVDPKLIEAVAVGASYGLILTDDRGQVAESLSLIGPGYPYRYNQSADPWIFTCDIQEPSFRPTFEVVGSKVDTTAPAAPTGLKVASVSPSDATVTLTFVAPGDDGGKGTALAYEAVYAADPITDATWDAATALPRWSLPLPVAGGQTQSLPVFTLTPGMHHLAVRAVDEAGNRGPAANMVLKVPARPSGDLLAPTRTGTMMTLEVIRPADASDAMVTDALEVRACGDAVKIDPVSGAALTDGDEYDSQALYQAPTAQAVWNSQAKQVQLGAAANEVVAFQLVLKKVADKLTNVHVAVSDLTGKAGEINQKNIQSYRLWYVYTSKTPPPDLGPGELADAVQRPSAWHGDACLPLAAPFDERFDIPATDNPVPAQQIQSVWMDVYVPRGTKAGTYKGAVTIKADQLAKAVEVPIVLEVLPLELPNRPTWIVELNRYHSVVGWAGVDAKADPQQALETTWDYYALGHQHRCELNALPYSHSGRVDPDYIPVLAGKGSLTTVADWSEWDTRFGPLLDGSAFSAARGYIGPCADEPITQMYLPFHEAWPIFPIEEYYGDYMDCSTRLDFAEWAKKARRVEDAFDNRYKQGYANVVQQWFEHCAQKGWTDTAMQFYFNNKYYWKVAFFGGMGRGGVSFWLLDEPVDFDDYDMNRFLFSLAKKGYEAAKSPQVPIHYRTDVSQPEMHRGLWDNVCNLWNCSAMMRFAPTAAVRANWITGEAFWRYGGGPGVSAPPVAMMRRLLSSWATGTTGDLPYWDTFRGTGSAWRKGNDLAIYYSGRNYAGSGKDYTGPIASVRLKLMRRVQQDIEYLHLLAGQPDWDRSRVRLALAEYADDATTPVWTFDRLTVSQWLAVRERVLATILRKP